MTKGQTDHTACPSCTFWKKASAFFLTIKLHLSIYVIKNAVGGLNKNSSLQLRFLHIMFSQKKQVAFRIQFYYLMDLHYSQTYIYSIVVIALFYYLMDLHYSQTYRQYYNRKCKFYYLMDLHYSQTRMKQRKRGTQFYYLMDLHYSQTL